MTAPVWMNAVITEFGRSAGVNGLVLNASGAAQLDFETGVSLHFEYSAGELVIAVMAPLQGGSVEELKRILALTHPQARYGVKVRAGLMSKTGKSVVAVVLPERDVTLPRLNAAFTLLWRLSGATGGAPWA